MLKLVKFEELASLLDLQKPSIDSYPALQLILTSVYSAIESFCGRNLESAEYTEQVYVSGRLVPVRALPIASVSSCTDEDGVNYAADVRIRPHYIQLPVTYHGNVIVTYVGGMADAPADLRRAALLQVAHEWQRKDTVGATFVSTDGGSTTWPQLGLLDEVKRLLSPYVHPERIA